MKDNRNVYKNREQQTNSEEYIASLLPNASNNGCDFVYKQSRSI